MSETANTEASKRPRSSSPSVEAGRGTSDAPPAKKQATEAKISSNVAPSTSETISKVEAEEEAAANASSTPAEALKSDRNEGKKYRRASGKEGEAKRGGRDRQPWGPKSGTREIVSTDGVKAEGSGEDGVKRLPKKRVALLIGYVYLPPECEDRADLIDIVELGILGCKCTLLTTRVRMME